MDIIRARNHLACNLARYALYDSIKKIWSYELQKDGRFTQYRYTEKDSCNHVTTDVKDTEWILTNELPKEP